MVPLLAALALTAAAQCGAHADPSLVVVSPGWLRQHLGQVTILAAVAAPGFARGHLPGAQPLPAAAVFSDNQAALLAALRRLGVGARGRIVLYQNGGLPVAAARALVALNALGLGARTSLLDGGLPAWQAAGGAVEPGPPRPSPQGDVSSCPSDVFVDRAYVASHLRQPHVRLLDARLPPFFSGAAAAPGEPAGHIPGASNLPFTTLTTPDGRFLSASALGARFRAAGVEASDELIVYCHSGRTASLAYLAARRLGLNARYYAGSWRDWSAPRWIHIGTSAPRAPGRRLPNRQLRNL